MPPNVSAGPAPAPNGEGGPWRSGQSPARVVLKIHAFHRSDLRGRVLGQGVSENGADPLLGRLRWRRLVPGPCDSVTGRLLCDSFWLFLATIDQPQVPEPTSGLLSDSRWLAKGRGIQVPSTPPGYLDVS